MKVTTIFFIFLFTCHSYALTAAEWTLNEQGYIDPSAVNESNYFPKIHRLEVFYDSVNKTGEKFTLYYFLLKNFDVTQKTILVIPGSGTIFNYRGLTPLSGLADCFNLVYFHARGSGMTKVDNSNAYDQYLQFQYLVEDLEDIRKDLGIERWDLVSGISLGAMLSQFYAHRYPNSVRRLLLQGSPANPPRLIAWEDNGRIRNMNLRIENRVKAFEHIFNYYPEFSNLRDDPELLDFVLKDIRKIWDDIRPFSDFRNIINSNYYDEPVLREAFPFLTRNKAYFKAMSKMNTLGSLPFSEKIQTWHKRIGAIVAFEALRTVLSEKKIAPVLDYRLVEAARTAFAAEPPHRFPDSSRRARMVMQVYEGLNNHFIEHLKRTHRDVLRAIASQSAIYPGYKSLHHKIGYVGSGPARIWNPALYQHQIPTLFFHGEEDVITPLEQGQFFYEHGTCGQKMIVTIPQASHPVRLPDGVKEKIVRYFLVRTMTDLIHAYQSHSPLFAGIVNLNAHIQYREESGTTCRP